MSQSSIKQFVQFRAKNPHMMAQAARIFSADRQNMKKLNKIQQKIKHYKQLLTVALQQRKKAQHSTHRQLTKIALEQHCIISKIQEVKLSTQNVNTKIRQRNQALQRKIKQMEQMIEQLQYDIQKEDQNHEQQIRKLQLQLNLQSQTKSRYQKLIKEKKAQISHVKKIKAALEYQHNKIVKMRENSVNLNNQITQNRNKIKNMLQKYQNSLKQKIAKEAEQKQQKEIEINQFIGDLNKLVSQNQILGLKQIITEFYKASSKQQIQRIEIPQEVLQQFCQQLKTSKLHQVDLDQQNFNRSISVEIRRNQKIILELSQKLLKAATICKNKQEQITNLTQKCNRISEEVTKAIALKKK